MCVVRHVCVGHIYIRSLLHVLPASTFYFSLYVPTSRDNTAPRYILQFIYTIPLYFLDFFFLLGKWETETWPLPPTAFATSSHYGIFVLFQFSYPSPQLSLF